VPAADTIYALSSGSPPAAIAVVRISGPEAHAALASLAGRLPEPRRAIAATLRHPKSGEVLDNALIISFTGPHSATGEDVAELHVHGGRSVVAAVEDALAAVPGLRQALPGEFTRRAFENGRIDLTEAEGLANLLLAETQSQRRAALALAGGALSRRIDEWRQRVLDLSARLEAALDFSDEGEVGEELPPGWSAELVQLVGELEHSLSRPQSERLRDGIRIVIAGPPNAGKSTLLNALAGREAAITSPLPGTTRDLVEAPTAIGGTPFLLIDTAGLREGSDEVEAIGVGRAEASIEAADMVLWLGDSANTPSPRAIIVQPKSDLEPQPDSGAVVSVSAHTGAGLDGLVALIQQRGKDLLPAEGEVALNQRHRAAVADAAAALTEAMKSNDLILASEALRQARTALDRVTGRAGVEDMLDALFGRFCVGK
jgi:tRNA modification GTPase